jgi:uncharacterized protein (TIGR02391 family)
MPSLIDTFPDAKTLLALTPEELGDVLLELAHKGIGGNPGMFSRNDFLELVNRTNTPAWPDGYRFAVLGAVTEAVDWLRHNGLIMFDPSQSQTTTYLRLSRRAQQLTNRQKAAAYREAAILPMGLVHTEVFNKAAAAFIRGDHDIAVFAAFKTGEVAVRQVGGYQENELGVKLMRKAFEAGKGPLADKTLEAGEQQAQSDLFAGAIGSAKNPASHRDVEMTKTEAARLLLLASYLLSIVDSRSQ